MPESSITLGVVMDPVAGITPAKDSTLAMLLEAQARGWKIVYLLQSGLAMYDGVPVGHGAYLSVSDDPDCWHEIGDPVSTPLADLDVILMRKDPPFDMEYIYTTYLLQRAEQLGAMVVNRPSSLREINEKAYTAWFPECCPPSLITRSMDDLHDFLQTHTRIVIKPLDGMGGKSIFVVAAEDLNRNVIFETLTHYGQRYALAQRYIPEIKLGDKRILLVDGEPIPYALARIPPPGDNRGNLVVGAVGEGRPLSERDAWICEQVGPAIKEMSVLFAGLDVIGDYLTEINVTSPTGIRELDRQFELNISARLMDVIAARLSA